MPRQASPESMVDRLESLSGKPLTEEQEVEVALWNKGRDLAFVVNSAGWDVVREMLQSYVTNEIDRLLSTDPASRDEVLAAHAVAFSANRIFTIFTEDVQRAVNASVKTPQIVKEQLSKLSPIPPESAVV